MTRATLLALADRVEALTGPCRETDAEVHHAILQGIGTGLYGTQPGYTDSLDAALTLVPETAFWKLGHDGEGADPSIFKACILSWTDGTRASERNSAAVAFTPALALTAAALRARAMMENSDD